MLSKAELTSYLFISIVGQAVVALLAHATCVRIVLLAFFHLSFSIPRSGAE